MQGLVSDKTFHLKWNNHLQNLSQLFTTIYSSSALADVTLSCRDGTLKAHKLVLSACSPYFEQIFKDNPCQHPIVILKGIPFSEINLLVEFMYKGSVDVQELDLQSLMHTASELEIRGLAYEARDNAAQLLNVNLEYPTYSQTVVPTQQTFTQARTDVERLKQIHMYQQSMMRAEEIRRRRREDTPGTHTAVNNILAAAAREMEEARQAARGNDRVVASIQTEQEAAAMAATDLKRESEEDRPKKRVSILSPEDDKLRAKKKAMTVRFQDDNKTEERPNKVTSPGATNNEPRNEIETKHGGIKVVQLAVLQKPTNNEHDDSDEKPGKPGMEDDEETDSSGSISDSAANDSQDSRPHVCDICDLRFQRSSHLSRHRLTHTGERPFTCGGCGRSFARSDKLRVHTKICEREDPTVDMANDQSTIKRENSSEVMSGMVRTTHRESGHLVFTASGDVMLPPGVSHAPAAPPAPAAHTPHAAHPAHPALARDDLEPPRRGRGRPRKTPLPLTPKIKKRRGRPPKTSLDMEGCVLTSGTVMGPSPQHMSHLTPSGQQLLLKRKRGRPPKNYFMSQGDSANDEPKNVIEIEAKQCGPKVVKLIVLRKVKAKNDDADSSPEKASKPEKKVDEGPDSSGSSSDSTDDSQDERSLATIVSDRKFQRSSHLFRRQHAHTEGPSFKCGSCGHDFARSDDALKHSEICKRDGIVDITDEPATIEVESNSNVSDVVPPSVSQSKRTHGTRSPAAGTRTHLSHALSDPEAPRRGRGRPPKFIRNKKKLNKKVFKPKRVVLRPRPVFKTQLTLAEQQLQLKKTRGRPPKNYFNRKKDTHREPSIVQGSLYSTSQNMQTIDLQNLEDSSSEVITGSLSPILESDGDFNRNVNLPSFYGFSNPTKIVFNPLADVHHSSFHDENSSQEEPEVIVPHVVMHTQIESEENVPSVGVETTIMSEDYQIVKAIQNKEEIKDKTDQLQTEANVVSTSTTSSITITSVISLNDNDQRPVEDT